MYSVITEHYLAFSSTVRHYVQHAGSTISFMGQNLHNPHIVMIVNGALVLCVSCFGTEF